MTEIKKIISKVILLIIDILRFGYDTAKQVILPRKRKRGNLLSSLFIFFVGIVERLDNFEHGVFHMTILLRRKYIKQGLLVLAGLLFILSSFEWTGEPNVTDDRPGNYITRTSDTSRQEVIASNYADASNYSTTTCLDKEYLPNKIIFHNRFRLKPQLKTFLLIQNIRI
jgi:hypothetical protein